MGPAVFIAVALGWYGSIQPFRDRVALTEITGRARHWLQTGLTVTATQAARVDLARLEKISRREPCLQENLIVRAALLARLDRRVEAVNVYSAALACGGRPEIFIWRATELERLGQYENADRDRACAILFSPQYAESFDGAPRGDQPLLEYCLAAASADARD